MEIRACHVTHILAILLFLIFSEAAGGGLAAPAAAGGAAKKQASESRADAFGADSRRSAESPTGGGSEQSQEKSLNGLEDNNATPERDVSRGRRKRAVRLGMSFSIGGLGHGVLGPRFAREGLRQFRYAKEAFEAGFRGGIEGLMFIRSIHCLSVGMFYEQRKIHYNIADTGMIQFIFPEMPQVWLYSIDFARYAFRSMVDSHYLSFPLTYRFYFYDEFFVGLSIHVSPLLAAKAGYGVLGLDADIDMRKRIASVDFGGRICAGVIMNRVLLEVGLGTGFLEYDRLPGRRRAVVLTGMMGLAL